MSHWPKCSRGAGAHSVLGGATVWHMAEGGGGRAGRQATSKLNSSQDWAGLGPAPNWLIRHLYVPAAPPWPPLLEPLAPWCGYYMPSTAGCSFGQILFLFLSTGHLCLQGHTGRYISTGFPLVSWVCSHLFKHCLPPPDTIRDGALSVSSVTW